MWFESLTGFEEESPEQVRASLIVGGDRMTSKVNGHVMRCGRLTRPTLGELRAQAASISVAGTGDAKLRLSERVDDVQNVHRDPGNRDAMFQVASQFNLLEMVSPSVTPESGVGIYEYDRTQGPACAIACGAGTIFRNYFADVEGRVGQSEQHQIDCLEDLGHALGNVNERLWKMRNGYALASVEGLMEISRVISDASEEGRDRLRQQLRIGIHSDTEVTLSDSGHTVSQAYCSALPVAYSSHSTHLWAAFAKLVLEASYEATFCAAIANWKRHGCNRLFLTLLGGGAFGNRTRWIIAAIERSLKIFRHVPLDVVVVSYGSSQSSVQEMIQRHEEEAEAASEADARIAADPRREDGAVDNKPGGETTEHYPYGTDEYDWL